MGPHWVWVEGGHCMCSGGWREEFILGVAVDEASPSLQVLLRT